MSKHSLRKCARVMPKVEVQEQVKLVLGTFTTPSTDSTQKIAALLPKQHDSNDFTCLGHHICTHVDGVSGTFLLYYSLGSVPIKSPTDATQHVAEIMEASNVL